MFEVRKITNKDLKLNIYQRMTWAPSKSFFVMLSDVAWTGGVNNFTFLICSYLILYRNFLHLRRKMFKKKQEQEKNILTLCVTFKK